MTSMSSSDAEIRLAVAQALLRELRRQITHMRLNGHVRVAIYQVTGYIEGDLSDGQTRSLEDFWTKKIESERADLARERTEMSNVNTPLVIELSEEDLERLRTYTQATGNTPRALVRAMIRALPEFTPEEVANRKAAGSNCYVTVETESKAETKLK